MSGAATSSSSSTTPIDLYKILDVSPTCSVNDIETRYAQLVMQYHPDKVTQRHRAMVAKRCCSDPHTPDVVRRELDGMLAAKLTETRTMFNLINSAYQRLTKDRASYDEERRLHQLIRSEGTFDALRHSSRVFADIQKTEVTDTVKDNYRQQWVDMNHRSNFNEHQLHDAPLDEATLNQRLSELQQLRSQMDTTTKPIMQVTTDLSMDADTFNELFDHQRIMTADAAIDVQPYNGIINADWATGGDGYADLSRLDTTYDDTVDSAIIADDAPTIPQPDTLLRINETGANYANNNNTTNRRRHAVDADTIDKRIADYNSLTKIITNYTRTDYTDDIIYGAIVPGPDVTMLNTLDHCVQPGTA